MDLMNAFLLEQVQLIEQKGRLLAPISKDQTLHAKLELKLSPRACDEALGTACYEIIVETEVDGVVDGPSGAEQQSVFALALKLSARYRQFQGAPVSLDAFSSHHTTLARQIYPRVHDHLTLMLGQLGLGHVQLPFDLAHAQSTEGEVAHSVQPQQLH